SREVRPDPAGPRRLCQPAHRHHRQGDQGARGQVSPSRAFYDARASAATMAPRPEPNVFSLAELAQRTGAAVEGDGAVVVARVATLEHGGPGDIAFLANPRYRAQLATTRASAVIVAPDAVAATSLPKLVSKNPYAVYARVASILHPSGV